MYYTSSAAIYLIIACAELNTLEINTCSADTDMNTTKSWNLAERQLCTAKADMRTTDPAPTWLFVAVKQVELVCANFGCSTCVQYVTKMLPASEASPSQP